MNNDLENALAVLQSDNLPDYMEIILSDATTQQLTTDQIRLAKTVFREFVERAPSFGYSVHQVYSIEREAFIFRMERNAEPSKCVSSRLMPYNEYRERMTRAMLEDEDMRAGYGIERLRQSEDLGPQDEFTHSRNERFKEL